MTLREASSGLIPRLSIARFGSCTSSRVSSRLYFGTLSRNVLRGPGINNWDLSIVKNTPLGGETRSLQFRAEFFNAFNHTQFSNPG